jgi:quinol monooxygenase YgiN
MHRRSRTVVVSAAALVASAAFGLAWLRAAGAQQQQAPAQPPAPSPAQAQPQKPAGDPTATLAGALVQGLQQTPGCLGVEVARTMSGKNVIFGWFENKKAAMAWYDSPAHKQAMERFFPGYKPDHAPMERIADDAGPIMAVACLVPARDPAAAVNAGSPVSQISIELYEPMPGGVRLNGGFAPATMKVEGMRDLSALKPQAAPAIKD